MPDWNLRVFEEAAHGVSVLYPASFSTVVDAADKLFSVSSPYGVPRMDVALTSDATDVAQLAHAYVASLTSVENDGRVYPRPSDQAVSERPASIGTTPLGGGALAHETTVDWQHAESQAELRTLVLSVPRAAGDRITLYLTGTRRHDWDDLRVAHTLRVAR